MKRVLIGVAVLIAAGAAALWVFRGPIAVAVMMRGAEAGMARDLVAELPDGLSVLMCGTGSPMPDPTRAGPCTAIAAGGKVYVIDAGSGAGRNLIRMGVRSERIAAVLLSHFHSDHIDGLGELLMLRWTGAAATAPLPVHGPAGVERIVDGFNAAYALDATYRTAHHTAEIAPPGGFGGRAAPFALPADDARVTLLQDGELTISVFRVNHDPVDPAVGFRFDYKGRSVVISGDTAPHPAVEAAAKDADILVHEALSTDLVAQLKGAATRAGRAGIAHIMGDIPSYHTTPAQAAEIAERAGAGLLVLTHIVPPLPITALEPAFLGDAPGKFSGDIYVGRDGQVFTAPAGGGDVQTMRAF